MGTSASYGVPVPGERVRAAAVAAGRPAPLASGRDVLEQQLGMSLKEASQVTWDAAYRITGNREAAEDLVQEVFVRLCRMAGAGTLCVEASGGRAYLRAAVRNGFYADYRRRTAVRRGSGVLASVIGVDVREEWLGDRKGDDPANQVVAAAFRDALDGAIGKLSAEHRQVVRLLAQGGLSQNEMADMLGLPPSTLRDRLKGAQAEVRTHLRRSGWEVDR